MTETVSTPVAETPTIDSSSQVSRPVESVKPYDMLDAYEEDSGEESTPEVKEEVKEVAPEKPEAPKEEEVLKEPKATKDDKVVDGLEELPVKRMINGKEVEFKIKDAITAYTKQEEFNRNMDRRVGEISRRERAWQSDQNNFKEKVSKVIEVTQQGDFVSGIRALAKLAAGSSSLDVVKFEKMYFDQLESVRKVYSEMTPEQQEAYFAKRSAAEARAEADKLKSEKAATTAQSELQAQVQSSMEKHNLSPDEFWGNYKVLAESEVGEGKKYQNPDDITTEDVIQYSLNVKHWEKVLTAGQKLGIEDDAILDEVSKITAAYPDLTIEDVEKVIKNAGLASPAAVENLNRKAGSSRLNSAASSTKKQNAEGYDEESLDFLYRNQPKAYSRVIR